MRFIVRVVDRVDMKYPTNNERWYLVEPENKLLSFLWNNIFLQYIPYLDEERAIKEARLRSEGKWKRRYEKLVRIIEVNKNENKTA